MAQASRQATTRGRRLRPDVLAGEVGLGALGAGAPRRRRARSERRTTPPSPTRFGWLEREVAFTRVGRGGARQVPVRGLVAAAFTHRDTRAGDPDLHTHVAVSNKVQALSDGRPWLALDGRLLYQANVAASERYNTRLEAELIAGSA